MSSAVDPDVERLEDGQNTDDQDSYSTPRYTDSLATCPMDGTILGEHTRRDRARRECPSCRRVWAPWEVFG